MFQRGTLGEVTHGQDYMPIKLSKKFNFWDLQTFQILALGTLTFKELPLDRNKLNLFTHRKNIKEAANTFKGISLLTYNEESVAKVQLPHRQQNEQLYIPEEAAHRCETLADLKLSCTLHEFCSPDDPALKYHTHCGSAITVSSSLWCTMSAS